MGVTDGAFGDGRGRCELFILFPRRWHREVRRCRWVQGYRYVYIQRLCRGIQNFVLFSASCPQSHVRNLIFATWRRSGPSLLQQHRTRGPSYADGPEISIMALPLRDMRVSQRRSCSIPGYKIRDAPFTPEPANPMVHVAFRPVGLTSYTYL
jgi:hypothetical protein